MYTLRDIGRKAETADFAIEHIGLLHVAHVPSVRDDGKLRIGDRRMELPRDVQGTATVIIALQHQCSHVDVR